MKGAIVLLFLVILLPSLSYAQDFWEQTNGPYGGAVNSLAINSTGHIFAGTSDSGVYRSTDNGDNWTPTGLTNGVVWSLAINSSGHIFAGTDSGVYRSTNNGDNWAQINTGLTCTLVHSLAINSSGHIFAGTAWNGVWDGVYRSTDNGDNWTLTGLTDINVFCLAINSSGYIFAGTIGVYRSTDNGDNWTPTGLTNGVVWSLAINSSGHIFAAIFPVQGTGPAYPLIQRSTNNGDNWTFSFEYGDGIPITDIAINYNQDVFAGTDSGVFRSTDNGDNWTPINTGLTNTSVICLALNSNGYIFAGTDSNGVYRSTQSTPIKEIKKEIPSSFELKQNYPNPFNPTTTIEFDIPTSSFVSLKVFNLIGQEVATLVNNELSQGNHKVEWKPDNLSSGLYFYKLETKGYVETKKLILLK